MIEWVFGDGSESPKETLYIGNHFAEISGYLIDFRGFLIDFRGFRKRYFLGFSPNLNGYSLFVNNFIVFELWAESSGWRH